MAKPQETSRLVPSGAPIKLSKELPALHTLKLLAALHIVLTHFSEANIGSHLFGVTGSTWLSAFFCLSGLGPAHSRLSGPAELRKGSLLPLPRTLARRLLSVYPLYLLGLLAS
eukprot:5863817-Prymnesium_polylepis.1